MRIKGFGERRKIYFIGIGGISMSALAKMLLGCGYRVSGYDVTLGREIQKLRELGAKVCVGEEDDLEELTRAEVAEYLKLHAGSRRDSTQLGAAPHL